MGGVEASSRVANGDDVNRQWMSEEKVISEAARGPSFIHFQGTLHKQFHRLSQISILLKCGTSYDAQIAGLLQHRDEMSYHPFSNSSGTRKLVDGTAAAGSL